MKNKFSFNDLMQFGLFLIALLTFIYLISQGKGNKRRSTVKAIKANFSMVCFTSG